MFYNFYWLFGGFNDFLLIVFFGVVSMMFFGEFIRMV